ncbi:MAG TPA: AAA family ATPase [Egibacteraceae bacterium]|nr:AAA family ATPase [Egibacteraceae bacterium]
MRITRIRLRDYRGVREREVQLLPTGVTVIAGPNEVGKSSLAEALDVLFDYYDTSTSKDVKAVQPVGRDVGAEIEADIECGAYRFTYAKRFHRGRQTILTLSTPTAETLVGREAHDRVQEILAEAMDVDLWKALRVQQGRGIDQPPLDGMASLAGALDRAAGEGASALGDAGERELTLLERAREEYLRYWTPTGREGAALKERAAALTAARGGVEHLERELGSAEQDALRSAELDALIAGQRRLAAAAGEEAARLSAALRSVEDLTGEVERLRLAVDVARGELSIAEERRQERGRLCTALERAEHRVKELAESGAGLAPQMEAAEACVDARSRARETAEADRQAGRRLVDERRRDLETLRALTDLGALRERRRRAAEALDRAAAAQERLAAATVDEAALERIRELHHSVEAKSAALAAQLPTLEIRAEALASLEVDSAARDFAPGESARWSVDRLLTLAVPGLIEIRIDPGAELEELAAEVSAKRQELARRCGEVGVDGLAGAEEAFEARRETEIALAQAHSEASRQLSGAEIAELDAQIAEASACLPASGAALPADAAAGQALVAEAEALCAQSEAALKAADAALADAEAAQRSAREVLLEHDAAQAGAEHEAQETGDALEEARRALPDDALDLAVHDGRIRVEAAVAAHQQALARLGAAQPDRVRAQTEAAAQAASAATRALRESEDERRDVQARLDVRGGEGLFESLASARSLLEHAERAAADLSAAADAARLLHTTLEACREEAQRAYAGPLRQKIVEMGRVVFGHSFDVDLADDLSVARRTLHGERLPFEQLSVGAREQLSLIARLACALLVSPDGGVPLLLDDTLGYSDDQRVSAMHEVVRLAGERCQVVILTCHPDRYRAIAGAALIDLG